MRRAFPISTKQGHLLPEILHNILDTVGITDHLSAISPQPGCVPIEQFDERSIIPFEESGKYRRIIIGSP